MSERQPGRRDDHKPVPAELLWREYRLSSDVVLRGELTNHYSHIAVDAARAVSRYTRVPEAELVTHAMTGLAYAVDRYDPQTTDSDFQLFARNRILRALLDEIEARGGLEITSSQRPSARAQSLFGGGAPIQRDTDAAASDPQYVAELPELYQHLSGAAEQPELYQDLADAIDALPEREKVILVLLYYQDLTLKEIAEILGVTDSRVNQLHVKAVLRLRGSLRGWLPSAPESGHVATLVLDETAGVAPSQSTATSPSRPRARAPASTPPTRNHRAPTAFVSWAHEHAGIAPEEWSRQVFDLAKTLRRLGVEVDVDLAHLHDNDVDWSAFGVAGIEAADFVLLVASSAYKERWEGKGSPSRGAGAAREANALKAIFDGDRQTFLKKVKIVLLRGVSVTDVPLELRSSAQRFSIRSCDEAGLANLLRVLAGKPAYVLPEVGNLPELPPEYGTSDQACND